MLKFGFLELGISLPSSMFPISRGGSLQKIFAFSQKTLKQKCAYLLFVADIVSGEYFLGRFFSRENFLSILQTGQLEIKLFLCYLCIQCKIYENTILSQFLIIYAGLSQNNFVVISCFFVWRQIKPTTLSVEKKGQMIGMKM